MLQINEAIKRVNSLPLLTDNPNIRGIKAMAESKLAKSTRICQVEGCNKKHWGRGYCLTHYNHARANGLLGNKQCKEVGCSDPSVSNGLCSKHYQQVNKHGHTHRTIYDPNIFEIDGDLCLIHIFYKDGGLKCKVKIDSNDLKNVNTLKWTIGSHGYAENVTTRTLLHRLILGHIPDGYEVDHINRDKLDNRDCNLRIVSRTQNAANIGINIANKSGFKGVCWVSRAKKYVTQVSKDGERLFHGYFDNKIDAARAYDKHALKAFGEFALTNERLGLL